MSHDHMFAHWFATMSVLSGLDVTYFTAPCDHKSRTSVLSVSIEYDFGLSRGKPSARAHTSCVKQPNDLETPKMTV